MCILICVLCHFLPVHWPDNLLKMDGQVKLHLILNAFSSHGSVEVYLSKPATNSTPPPP